MDLSFETIVLAVGPQDDDRLDRLAQAVLQVAKPTDATVVLTHVFTQEQFENVAAEIDLPNATTEDVNTVLKRHQSVRRLERLLEEHDVDYDLRGVVGDVSDGIVSLAGETNADRVVVSGATRSPVGKAMFGSTTQDVLLGAPCPVTYVRSPAE
ncbi:universal stress protein [Halococcus salifodinae]|uniref:UspA domain-containing protein n=1 Tax=Halococcus salifodinae DSM 8989 TaxID=1227456 RepID=M0NB24_9EURY|nr:universal stress protein [Halococcus salifodinae]EMA54304.1 UspA domain-containing protein [Halococcus salifodinae DSM 8989]